VQFHNYFVLEKVQWQLLVVGRTAEPVFRFVIRIVSIVILFAGE